VNCEALSKQIEKLAKHFKGFENLVFARIDASANEHTKLQVDDKYPIILLYKSGEKEKPVITILKELTSSIPFRHHYFCFCL
jgi:protein disulfide-isomerase A1